MWRYYLDDRKIEEAISNRMRYQDSEKVASQLLKSLGYEQEVMIKTKFDDLIFTSGSMDETFSSKEIYLAENMGNVFSSRGKDMFDFYLVDIDEEHYTDER